MGNYSLNIECEKIAAEIAEVAGWLWEREWAERNGGNISVDVTGLVENGESHDSPHINLPIAQTELSGRSYLVKAAGSRMYDLAKKPEENLLLITLDKDLGGYSILRGGKDENSRPTSEFISHLKIHQYLRINNMPQKVFIHTHPTHLIALSHIDEFRSEEKLNELLSAMHPEVKIHIPDGIGFAPYRCPGSEDLADVTVNALPRRRVILWEKHGCTAVAENPVEAFDLIDVANKAAQIFFLCKSAGYSPSGLNADQLAEIDDKFNGKRA